MAERYIGVEVRGWCTVHEMPVLPMHPELLAFMIGDAEVELYSTYLVENKKIIRDRVQKVAIFETKEEQDWIKMQRQAWGCLGMWVYEDSGGEEDDDLAKRCEASWTFEVR